MMIKVNRANEILGDDEMRRIYDQRGDKGIEDYEKQKTAGNARHAHPFASFFHGGHGHQDDEEKRGPDVHAEIHLTLEDIYNGIVYDLSIYRQTLCNHCFGSGADSDNDIITCPKCNGEGHYFEQRRMGPGFIQQIQRECTRCHGLGKIIKNKCHVCHGSGVDEGLHSMLIDIQPGTPNGHKIELDHENDEFPDKLAGNIYFTIVTIPGDTKYKRRFIRDEEKPENLHYFAKISIVQALLGYNINIRHLDGHIVNLKKEGKITKPNSIRTIKNEGMPVFESFPRRFGNLIVHFEVIWPKNLTEKQKEVIQKLNL